MDGVWAYYLSDAENEVVQRFLAAWNNKEFVLTDANKQLLSELVASLTDERIQYDENYGDSKKCELCTHDYYRHFDPYADMEPVGCKYCECDCFVK